MPTSQDFQTELDKVFQVAQGNGKSFVDVTSGDLHRQVGDYPSGNHRMPLCCAVMRQNMREGDSVISEPPSGEGATLTIRYKLPR